MNLLDELFRSAAMERIFSETEHLQSLLHFEAALARAEAQAELFPEAAARAIAIKCQPDLFDLKAISEGAARSGNLAIPVIKQLTELVAKDDSHSARFVHWGATSQDVIDTAVVLQLRRAFEIFEKDLQRLSDTLAGLIGAHRNTLLVGRTWMQQALPTTFGFIVAGWLDAILRDRKRLQEIRERALTLQFGGAVGTLAALGAKGPAVAEALAKDLRLSLPATPWHSHRDRFAEVATTFGICCGNLSKIARDISLHSQTEIGELSEPAADGRGGSSSMPHKRNSVTCAVVLAAGQRVPGLVCTMLTCMDQEEQRGLGSWHAEWETLPEIICLTAGALGHLTQMLSGLEVHTDRMKINLHATSGLIFAEAVSLALAEHMGKPAAHGLVEAACKKALDKKRPLKDVLLEDAAIAGHLAPADIDRLFEAQNYLGSATTFADRVLAEAREASAER
jgi:3-carboxy-cis,cis-muconate cycloisomerase